NLPSKEWVEYLWQYLRTDDANTFGNNRVHVITFNFDRSFERRLFVLLRAYYGVSDDVAGRLRAAIPVLHLHGQLGGEKWLGENRPDSRDYLPEATVEQKVELLDKIRIVHEEMDRQDLRTAHE